MIEKSTNNLYNRVKFAAIANFNSSVSSHASTSSSNESPSSSKSKLIPIAINHMNSSDEVDRRAYEAELIRRRHDMFKLIYRDPQAIMSGIYADRIDRNVDETVANSEINEDESTTNEFVLFPFDAIE